ncbi:hypothetical protein ILYODFUR_013887 [Ilyodon furcidens]|uniref:Uncharacterized protein n=1 Tax=Ilyodon furcidens TaxID=33524 RepID=A0ABV0TIG1_9TELE
MESSIIMYLAVSGGADMCVVSGEAGGETETAAESGDLEPGGVADTWFHLRSRSTGQHEQALAKSLPWRNLEAAHMRGCRYGSDLA